MIQQGIAPVSVRFGSAWGLGRGNAAEGGSEWARGRAVTPVERKPLLVKHAILGVAYGMADLAVALGLDGAADLRDKAYAETDDVHSARQQPLLKRRGASAKADAALEKTVGQIYDLLVQAGLKVCKLDAWDAWEKDGIGSDDGNPICSLLVQPDASVSDELLARIPKTVTVGIYEGREDDVVPIFVAPRLSVSA